MDEPDSTYAPQSPDLSAYNSNSSTYIPEAHSQNHYSHNNFAQRQSYGSSPYFSPDPQLSMVPPYQSRTAPTQVKDEDNEYLPDAPNMKSNSRSRAGRAMKREVKSEGESDRRNSSDIVVKTKFPVARIKRIMQADEDVGKVAQVTPVIVSKALELFMISLVCKAAEEANNRSQKRITASHLKNAIARDEQFDFLQDIIAKVPDAPTAGDKSEEGEDGAEPKKKRAGGRRRKVSEEL